MFDESPLSFPSDYSVRIIWYDFKLEFFERCFHVLKIICGEIFAIFNYIKVL